LLSALSFDTKMLSASVANAKGEWGPEFDHMTLLVTIDERWLVDVGFGDSFIEPLPLDDRNEHLQRSRAYRIEEVDDRLMLLQKEPNEDWKPQYGFTLEPHVYEDYAAMCRYQQTSPQSHFTQRRICSRLTADGRITISQQRLIITRGTLREEREFANETDVVDALREHFDIVL
jgi:N-hydroxyarylamine O-acetyltransferase